MRINLCSRKSDEEKILGNKDVSRKEKLFFSFPKAKAVFPLEKQ